MAKRIGAAAVLVVAGLAAILACRPAAAAETGLIARTVHTADGPRRYLVFRPAAIAPGAHPPLVLMLHGGFGRAETAARDYGWIAKARTAGFIAAFPEGTRGLIGRGRFWNEGSGRGPGARRGIDDVRYIAAVIDDLIARDRVDPRRVYVTGFSMGGGMAHRLGAQLARRIAAIAPVSGHAWLPSFAPARPMPVLWLVGGADPINPLAGGMGKLPRRDGRPKPSIMASVAKWRAADRCAEPHRRTRAGSVERWTWTHCAGGVELRLIFVHGMGHRWPGRAARIQRRDLIGPPPPADVRFRAVDLIWSFFERHRLPLQASRSRTR
jgi:polyhydroxybutyrate depolymerase